MTFEERIRLIKTLENLIKLKYRGNSSDYARKLGISNATFFRLMNYIKKELNAPICYNKGHRHYEYCESRSMNLGFLPPENSNHKR